MAKGLPYFRWFPADAVLDEKYRSLTLEELGLYHQALNWSWMNNGLPSDHTQLAAIFRLNKQTFNRLWKQVGVCWYEENGRYFNPRQEEERECAVSKSQKSSVASAKGRSDEPGFIYLIQRDEDGAIKIGSAKNVARRLAQLRYKYRGAASLSLVGSFAVEQMGSSEVRLHETYKEQRLNGEWFALTARHLRDITITLKGDIGGDIGGDNTHHPAPRAYDSDSVSVSISGKLEPGKIRVTDLNGSTSQRFEEWWEVWSRVRGSYNKIAACQAYISVVTVDREDACFECTRSYLASLKDPSNGFNPDNFLFKQSQEEFASRWIPRKKSQSEIFAEMEREAEEIDRRNQNATN